MTTSRIVRPVFTALGFAILFFAAPGLARAVEPIHALLLTGGCCHDYGAQLKILTEGISARANVDWDIRYEGGSSTGGVKRSHRMSIYDKPDWSKGYDIVVHNECFGDVTNAEFVEHIAKGHFDGVPWLFIVPFTAIAKRRRMNGANCSGSVRMTMRMAGRSR